MPVLINSIQTVTVDILAEKYNLTVPEAVAKFRRGPQYEPCELKVMQEDLMGHLSEEATVKLQAFSHRMKQALSSEAFLSRL